MEGAAQYIVQCGNNRDVCFYAEADYAFYVQQLNESAKKYKVAVHAFVLMTNHVHLLVTPSAANGVSLMLQSLGRQYVGYVNRTYGRTGTLWEGRFKSSLVSSDRYFLTVSRYIEMNPVRAHMVELPGEYPWSSYRHNAMGIDIALVTEHKLYLDLGKTKAQRLLQYRFLFDVALPNKIVDEIRLCTNKGWIIGNEKFRQQIEYAFGRKINGETRGGDRRSISFLDRD